MRIGAGPTRSHDGHCSMGRAAAMVATTSILCGVVEEDSFSEKCLHVITSNCRDGDHLTNLHLKAAFGNDWTCEGLQNAVQQMFGGGLWTSETPGIQLDGRSVCYSVRTLDKSLHTQPTFTFLQKMLSFFAQGSSHVVHSDLTDKNTYHVFALTPPHIADRVYTPFMEAERWFNHLRQAGVSEFEIAHLPPPHVVAQTSRAYQSGCVTYAQAIRTAIHRLAEADGHYDSSEPEDSNGRVGIYEPLCVELKQASTEFVEAMMSRSLRKILDWEKRGSPPELAADGTNSKTSRAHIQSLDKLLTMEMPLTDIYKNVVRRHHLSTLTASA